MECVPSPDFPELLIITPDVFADARGHFLETWQRDRYVSMGVPGEFVQSNLSFSKRGVLRGLHFQSRRPQGKLIWPLTGTIYDIVVDIRKGSPTFGRWFGIVLDADDHRQLYVPQGFAHGFVVRSPEALVTYQCTDYYDPGGERGIRWDDPTLAIDWGVARPLVSPKDAVLPTLADCDPIDLPVYKHAEP